MTTVAQLAFWISALLLLHAFAGYPACMVWIARRRPRPVRKQPVTPTVTVVIAIYDGAAHIRDKLASLRALDYPADRIEIVIACDGCRDTSAELCRWLDDPGVRVLEFDERRGKAACLNDAIAVAEGEILLMTDVRQRLDVHALRELVANFADPEVGAVSGELRFEDPQTGFARGVDTYWRYETLIRHAESRSGSTIGVSGALYAMRRALFLPLPLGTVLDDVLIPMRVAKAGKRVIFEPLAVAWDRLSLHPAEERRRKIRTLAGNFQLMQLAPWLLAPWRNPLWFRFVSHKALRLLAPWLLALFMLAIIVLASRHAFYAFALCALFGGALLVALTRMLRMGERWLPVRAAVAFFYLNLFAAQALVAFARNRRLHLW
ncbi:glycosyltransferase family 2 protein [Dyella lipolytica]|uniref:Glycosyltransferase family 2 protein n=2 Tax=Dyella lipolytica TaxID=1867835 RepID=A0ABW8IUG0_9GAMM